MPVAQKNHKDVTLAFCSQSHMQELKMEPPAVKGNSEMFGLKLQYFQAAQNGSREDEC